MQFPEAYSHRLQCLTNVDKAVRAFDLGYLHDPKDFQCPDTHCSAPLRLNALVGALSGNTPGKRDPYFTTDGERSLHDPDCEFLLAENLGSTFRRTRPNWKDDRKNINLDDVFDWKRPNIVHPQVGGSGTGVTPSAAQRAVIATRKAQRQNLSHYSLLESVVDRYLGLSTRLATGKGLQIAGIRLTYSDAFVEVQNIELKGLGSNDIRIFHGVATLMSSRVDKCKYDFYFDTPIQIQGQEHAGSFKVWENDLQAKPGDPRGPGITRMARRLTQALCRSKSVKVRLFVLGKYLIRTQKKGDKEYLWLNLQVDNLDHVYFMTI